MGAEELKGIWYGLGFRFSGGFTDVGLFHALTLCPKAVFSDVGDNGGIGRYRHFLSFKRGHNFDSCAWKLQRKSVVLFRRSFVQLPRLSMIVEA